MSETKLPCPCCGYLTLDEPGSYEICSVCFWEDEGESDPDYVTGANGVSLNQARANYKAFSANSEQDIPHVRPPQPEEAPS